MLTMNSKTTNVRISFDCGCYYESGVMYDCDNHGGYITKLGIATIQFGPEKQNNGDVE